MAPLATSISRVSRSPVRPSPRPLAAYLLAAAASLVAAGFAARTHWKAGEGYGGWAAAAFIAAAAIWLGQARRHYAGGTSREPLPWHDWLRAAIVGLAVAYALALLAGPRPGVAALWAALTALWFACCTRSLTVGGRVRQWLQNCRGVGRAGRMAYRLTVFTAALEVALQYTERDPPGPASSTATQVSGEQLAARVKTRSAPTTKVALLGGTEELNRALVQHLASESFDEAIQLVWSPAVGDWCEELDALLSAPERPSLALAVIRVDRDLPKPTIRNWFDYRQLRIAQHMLGWFGRAADRSAPPRDAREAFLADCESRLNFWRTPSDPIVEPSWEALEDHLANLSEKARAERIGLLLVVIPSPVETNRPLAQTLLNRRGLAEESVDWELPARRITAIAQARSLPLVDLLPVLRRCETLPHARHSLALSESGGAAAASAIGSWLRVHETSTLAARGK